MRFQVVGLIILAVVYFAIAFVSSPKVPLLLWPAFIFFLLTMYRSYQLGTKQGLVISEEDLPRNIHQIIHKAHANSDYTIAIIRGGSGKLVACESLAGDDLFKHFTVQGDFLIPK